MFPLADTEENATLQRNSSIPNVASHMISYLTISVNINVNDSKQENKYSYLIKTAFDCTFLVSSEKYNYYSYSHTFPRI